MIRLKCSWYRFTLITFLKLNLFLLLLRPSHHHRPILPHITHILTIIIIILLRPALGKVFPHDDLLLSWDGFLLLLSLWWLLWFLFWLFLLLLQVLCKLPWWRLLDKLLLLQFGLLLFQHWLNTRLGLFQLWLSARLLARLWSCWLLVLSYVWLWLCVKTSLWHWWSLLLFCLLWFCWWAFHLHTPEELSFHFLVYFLLCWFIALFENIIFFQFLFIIFVILWFYDFVILWFLWCVNINLIRIHF